MGIVRTPNFQQISHLRRFRTPEQGSLHNSEPFQCHDYQHGHGDSRFIRCKVFYSDVLMYLNSLGKIAGHSK